MIQYNLSPSFIARYFYHNCDRYLRFHATPYKERKKLGIPLTNVEQSPVTNALLEAGLDWEETVVKKKLSGKVHLPYGEGHLSEHSFNIEESLSIISTLELNESIYQPTIPITQSFFEKYGLNQNIFNFSPCRPDLIRFCNDEYQNASLQIIDIKASDELNSSHRIQATLYSLIINETLKDKGIQIPVNLNHAGIWLYEQDNPELFDQQLTIQVLNNFFRYHLPEIIKKPIEDISWHLYHRCELCEFYQFCRKNAKDCDSISLIPSLTVEGKRHLEQQQTTQGNFISNLSELSDFLSFDSSDKILSSCGSLRNRKDHINASISALKNDNIILNGGLSLALPANESVCIILSLQNDPVSGQIYAAGFKRFKGKGIYDSGFNESIYIAKSLSDCVKVRKDFVRSLYHELEILDNYNKKEQSFFKKKTLQTYVYDTYELEVFNQLLKEALVDPDVQEEALQLQFYYQNEVLKEETVHPREMIEYPVVVLNKEIQNIAALPIPFSLRLPEVHKALIDSVNSSPLKPMGLFWFEHSNRLKSDAIAMVWNRKKPEAILWIHSEISRRMSAVKDVLDSIRDKAGNILFRWPQNFQFPYTYNYHYPELSKLIFITRYESFLGALETRELRTQSLNTRVSEGISIPIQCFQGDIWVLLKPLDIVKFGRYETFSYIIVPDSKESENNQMKFNDYFYRTSLNSSGKSKVSFTKIEEKFVDSASGLIKAFLLQIKYNVEQKEFKPGDTAIIHPRFTDFTSDKVIEKLKQLDNYPNHDFIKLIKNPLKLLVPVNDNKNFIQTALEISSKIGLTESQKYAFNHLVQNRLTLVWGPPGTGKTHFLAKAILTLIQARKSCGSSIRIGLTAFTHAAIENLLIKINELMEEFDFNSDLPIYKVGKVTTSQGERFLKVFDEEKTIMSISGKSYILGGTVFGLTKLIDYILPFDILIIDEASQMKPGDLALAIDILSDGGRIVLAGDDLQLPPIIKGSYNQQSDGKSGLEESIFAYVRGRDNPVDPKYTCKLQENWRMNYTLSSFAAESLYGSDYHPVSGVVGNQELKLIEKSKIQNVNENPITDFIDLVLDPRYPLTLCILENVKATLENENEAELIGSLVYELRKLMVDQNTGQLYPDSEEGDYKFWHEGLFIVSPHHAQIEMIQSKLGNIREWKYHPFVDTVDKMQGQEANAVIVSYGVSDIETAINEAEFIYSLNRLNVSVTRARSKCILFLPRPLLEPPIELFQNDKAANGLHYMLKLQRFCQENGNTDTFTINLNEEDSIKVTVMSSKVEMDYHIDNRLKINTHSVEKKAHEKVDNDELNLSSLKNEKSFYKNYQISPKKLIDEIKEKFFQNNEADDMILSPDEVGNDKILEEAYNLQEYISELKKEQKRIETIHKHLLERAKSDNIKENGPFQLDIKIRKTRKIIPDLFYSRFPDIFRKIATVSVTEAEKAVGKNMIEDIVEIKESERIYVKHMGKD